MKNKTKKTKKIVWFFISLAANLGLASLVTSSCGNHTQPKATDDFLNYDEKFGFNLTTYNNLEENLDRN